jgi:hypothetical protein
MRIWMLLGNNFWSLVYTSADVRSVAVIQKFCCVGRTTREQPMVVSGVQLVERHFVGPEQHDGC